MDMTHCGTPVYMAPEIADYQDYGKKADLWSLGAILLEMVVGNKPWPNCSRIESGKKKKQFFYRFADGGVDLKDFGIKISPLYLELVRGLLKKNPDERLSWEQMMENPVIKYAPKIYKELLDTLKQQTQEFILKPSNI